MTSRCEDVPGLGKRASDASICSEDVKVEDLPLHQEPQEAYVDFGGRFTRTPEGRSLVVLRAELLTDKEGRVSSVCFVSVRSCSSACQCMQSTVYSSADVSLEYYSSLGVAKRTAACAVAAAQAAAMLLSSHASAPGSLKAGAHCRLLHLLEAIAAGTAGGGQDRACCRGGGCAVPGATDRAEICTGMNQESLQPAC